MKEVTMGKVIKTVGLQDEMQAINRYTRRELKDGEVYTFSIVLCDNEVDRDFERFSIKSLEKMAELFEGKTGIFDHSMMGKDQTARIFKAYVEQSSQRTTSVGEPYTMLVARAYMPRTEKNKCLIEEIETGIKKEVSVGCAVKKTSCSVCGQNLKEGDCLHKRGVKYDGKVCHGVLDDVTDAYEWSFVAVPAQPMAGIIKSFDGERGVADRMDEILSRLEKNCEKKDIDKIKSYIASLEKSAKDGIEYKDALRKQVEKMSVLVLPDITTNEFANIAKKLSVEELKSLKKAFEKQQGKIIPPTVQLGVQRKQSQINNSDFKI